MTQMENFSLDFNILNYTFFSKQVYELHKLLKDNLGLPKSQINQQEFKKIVLLCADYYYFFNLQERPESHLALQTPHLSPQVFPESTALCLETRTPRQITLT